MAFNPLEHRGIPLDQQVRNWRELNVEPIDPDDADPYTRCRIITMNGIEVEAIFFSHHFTRHLPRPGGQAAARRDPLHRAAAAEGGQLAAARPVARVLETTIAYEQVAVDLTAWVARHGARPVPEAGVRVRRAGGLRPPVPVRQPLRDDRAPQGREDRRRPHRGHAGPAHRPCSTGTPSTTCASPTTATRVDPLSKLHALTIMAAEQQTMNFYMNVGPQYMEPIARQLYQEIGLIEEEHVTHYESLRRPGRDLVGAAGQPRVQRVLPVPLVHGAGERPPDEGDLGAAPEHGAGAPAAGLRPDAPARRPGAGGDPRPASCRSRHLRAEQGSTCATCWPPRWT